MHCALTIHKHPSETTHCIGRSVKDRPIKYQRMTLGNKVVNYNIPGWSNEHFWGSANHWICQRLSGSYHWCETSFSLFSSIDHWASTKTKETKVRVGETSASVINIPNGALLQMIPHSKVPETWKAKLFGDLHGKMRFSSLVGCCFCICYRQIFIPNHIFYFLHK